MIKAYLVFVFFLLLLPSKIFAATPYEECAATAVDPYIECAGYAGDPSIDSGPVTHIQQIFTPAQFFDDPSSIFNILLSNILLIAGIILFLLVIAAGFQMIQAGSSGDAHEMEKWRTMLLYGVIGFVIILLAGTIIKLVEVFTGINILNPEAVLNQ